MNKKILFFFLLLLSFNKSSFTRNLKFHNQLSSIALEGINCKAGIVPGLSGWQGNTIINNDDKSEDIKLDTGFILNTLKKSSAPGEETYFNNTTLNKNQITTNLIDSLIFGIDSGNSVRSVDWSPDGNYLAIGGYNPTSEHDEIEIYSFDGTTLTLTYSQDYGYRVYSVAWRSDGNYLAVGGENPTDGSNDFKIYKFNESNLSLQDSASFGDDLYAVAWRPDGEYVIAAGYESLGTHLRLYSFDGTSLTLISYRNWDSITRVNSAKWSPCGNYLALGTNTSGSNNTPLLIYKFDGTDLSFTNSGATGMSSQTNDANEVAWSPNGKHIAIAGNNFLNNKEIKIVTFNPPEIIESSSAKYTNDDYPFTIDWSKDGNYLATAGRSNTENHPLQIYSFNDNTIKLEYEKENLNWIWSARFSPNDNFIAIGKNGDSSDNIGIEVLKIEYLLTGLTQDNIYNSNAILQKEDVIKWNSDAILNLDVSTIEQKITNTYNNFIQKTTNNSNAILKQLDSIKWNSNAILNILDINVVENKLTNTYLELNQKINNNSNAILENNNQIGYNSNLITNITYTALENKLTNTYLELNQKIINNSNAILENQNLIKYNSNAILNISPELMETKLTQTYNKLSNKIKWNSNAILNNQEQIKENSNAILYFNEFEQKTTNTYQELLLKIKNNSNSILHNKDQISWNSSAFLQVDTSAIEQKITNTYFELNLKVKNNSNTILTNKQNIKNNSNAILNSSSYIFEQNLTNTYNKLNQLITNNSNALLTNQQKIYANSNTLLNSGIYNFEQKITNTYFELDQKTKYNSNVILTNKNKITWNSNAIISYDINAFEQKLTNTYFELDQKIKNNSNTILKNKTNIIFNSNALISIDVSTLEQKLKNTYLNINPKITYNSNQIIENHQDISNNSNAIIKLNQDVQNTSNEIILLENNLTNTHNYLNSLITNNSNELIITTDDILTNSDSIIHLEIELTQTYTELSNEIKWNSNALINNQEKIKNNSNTISNSINNINSNFNNTQTKIKNNSNAIISSENQIKQNSNTFETFSQNLTNTYNNLTNKIKNNSNAIMPTKDKANQNSNAIATNTQDIKYNSDAIVNLAQGSTAGGIQSQINTLTTKVKYNSNAIIYLLENADDSILTREPITTDIELENSVFIHPPQKIEIAGNVTIDGKGAIVIFADPDHSQFKIRAGYTVTLKNIQFLRFNQNTFDLRYALVRDLTLPSRWRLDDAQIKIGENVLFGLSENITLSQGLIEIINDDQSNAQTFLLKGIEGQKQLKFEPNDEYSNALSRADNNLSWDRRIDGIYSRTQSQLPDRFTQNNLVPVLFKCKDNTFGIQNINLAGFEHITKSNSLNFNGAIGLLGDSDIDIGYKTFTEYQSAKNIKETYDMTFVIQDLNNSLRLLKDDLKFTGAIQFADFGENILHIDTTLNQKIIPKIGDDKNRSIPQINFGTEFMQLTSSNGIARLIFDDNRIRIKNDIGGFIVQQNSYLKGNTIEITGDPIRDIYDPSTNGNGLILEVEELIGLDDIDNQPIIFESYLNDYIKKQTSIDLIYKKELSNFLNY